MCKTGLIKNTHITPLKATFFLYWFHESTHWIGDHSPKRRVRFNKHVEMKLRTTWSRSWQPLGLWMSFEIYPKPCVMNLPHTGISPKKSQTCYCVKLLWITTQLCETYGGFLSHRGTPVYHPFRPMGFSRSQKPSSKLVRGTPLFRAGTPKNHGHINKNQDG